MGCRSSSPITTATPPQQRGGDAHAHSFGGRTPAGGHEEAQAQVTLLSPGNGDLGTQDGQKASAIPEEKAPEGPGRSQKAKLLWKKIRREVVQGKAGVSPERSVSTLFQRTRSNLQEILEFAEGTPKDAESSSGSDATAEDEHRRDVICGVEKNRLLPPFLITSVLLSAVITFTLERRLAERFLGSAAVFTTVSSLLYGVTLACWVHATLRNPGEAPAQEFTNGSPLPQRAHQSWLYARPLFRYDHYCRWIGNCIALRNHREFLVMVVGFASISVLGSIVDAILVAKFVVTEGWLTSITLILHFIYMSGFAYYVVPILRIHVGLVSRNELAKEWKDDIFYIIRDSETGEQIAVNDLDVETYNEYFDKGFEYDPTRNPFDKGWKQNCLAFWCTPRWAPGQHGEF